MTCAVCNRQERYLLIMHGDFICSLCHQWALQILNAYRS
jgi:hypothetical protein